MRRGSVRENVSLSSLTTLGVGGPARTLIDVETNEACIETVKHADAEGEPLLLLGGGSNLVVGDDGFAGTVVRVATRGVSLRNSVGADTTEVSVAAGEPWDAFVARCVSEGLSGIECLSGIPGLVGAVPMQNVGAYGQDVGQTIARVTVWDRTDSVVRVLSGPQCGFGYRSSVLRGSTRFVVLNVVFALRRSPVSGPLAYAELTKCLGLGSTNGVPIEVVRDAVLALRRAKGMVLDDADADTASAGSFFTNPLVDDATLATLRARLSANLEAMPAHPSPDGRTKLSAAWLIERAGFPKGYTLGRAGVSTKHALALINRGGATTSEILALARAIRDSVLSRFGVLLENEPVFVGVKL
jgi:UDP-N-acetylmuramate dehydrogenase